MPSYKYYSYFNTLEEAQSFISISKKELRNDRIYPQWRFGEPERCQNCDRLEQYCDIVYTRETLEKELFKLFDEYKQESNKLEKDDILEAINFISLMLIDIMKFIVLKHF